MRITFQKYDQGISRPSFPGIQAMVKYSSEPAARIVAKKPQSKKKDPLLPPITFQTPFTAHCSLVTTMQAKHKWKRRPACSMGSSISNTHYS